VAVVASAATMRTAVASASELAARQRTYAARDASIEPETIGVPDLHSPRVLRLAAKAGVDVDDRSSVDAADRRYSRQQAKAWTARH
jgi:hypothetical protein